MSAYKDIKRVEKRTTLKDIAANKKRHRMSYFCAYGTNSPGENNYRGNVKGPLDLGELLFWYADAIHKQTGSANIDIAVTPAQLKRIVAAGGIGEFINFPPGIDSIRCYSFDDSAPLVNEYERNKHAENGMAAADELVNKLERESNNG